MEAPKLLSETIYTSHHENQHGQEGEHEYPLFCPFQCGPKCIDNSMFIDYGLATGLCGLCIFVSLWHIGKHLKYFTNPHFQAKIILILCMAPFYCASSIISIYYHEVAPYLMVVRDCYEAFLLFTFFYLIFSYLAYDDETDQINDDKLYSVMIIPDNTEIVKQVYHLWPFNYCARPYKLSSKGKAKYFTYRCKKWVLQCFVLKPIAAILTLILTPFAKTNIYCSWGLTFISVIVCISVSYSLYYLILFYYALKKPLAPYNPLAKFLVIKITLFFTFWQALTLIFLEEELLECFDQTYKNYDGHKIMVGIENTLICIEMLAMSLVGGPAFTFHEFKDNGEIQRGKFKDVLKDLFQTFLHDFRLIKPKSFGMRHSHRAVDHERNSHLSQTSLVGEFKIEMYDENNDKKFSYHPNNSNKNSMLSDTSDVRDSQQERDSQIQLQQLNGENIQYGQELHEISHSKKKKKKKNKNNTDLNQLLIPNEH